MKLHRFIHSDIEGVMIGDKKTITNKKIIHQIKNVFRMKEGAKVIFCDGNFKDYFVSILDIKSSQLEVLIEEIRQLPKKEKEVWVYVSIIKPNKFDDLILHLVEVGATKIIPLITSRTQKRNLKMERLQEILKEGSEQSGVGYVPEIKAPMYFKEALESCDKKIILFHPNKNKKTKLKKEDIAIFIGPEGGFTNKELFLAEQNGAEIIGLGGNILRAETAGIIGTYLVSQNIF